MASKYSSLLQDLEEEITCVVCHEIFNDPHALSCLHTLCLQCANSIAQTKGGHSVQCPTCRQTTPLKDLKKDFRMIQSIERYHKSTAQPTDVNMSADQPSGKWSKICELCEEKPPVYKCQKL